MCHGLSPGPVTEPQGTVLTPEPRPGGLEVCPWCPVFQVQVFVRSGIWKKKPEDIEPAFFFSPIWAARGKFLYFLVGNFFYHSLFFLSITLNFFYKIYILILVCQNSRHENQFIFRETRSESHHRRHWRSDLECIKFLHRLMIKLTVDAKSWKFVFNEFIFCWSFNRQKLCAQEITNHLKWKLLNGAISTMLGTWDHLKMRLDKTYNALWTKLP